MIAIAEYQHVLNVLKDLMIGPGEADSIRNIIQGYRIGKQPPVHILDVGTGDGRYLSKVIKGLPRGDFLLTALEPNPTAFNVARKRLYDVEVIDKRLEHFQNRQYDIVMSLQSVYYFETVELFFEKTLNVLRPNGIIILVVWNDDCILYKLGSIFSEKTLISSSSLLNWIKEFEGTDVKLLSQIENSGRFDSKRFQSLEDNRKESVIRLLTRSYEKRLPHDWGKKVKSLPELSNQYPLRQNSIFVIESVSRMVT